MPEEEDPAAARERLARAQYALLAALLADAPPPPGFDRRQLAIQRRALIGKRATVVAKVAPQLPEILGDSYRSLFHAYARGRPMTGGHRQDADRFAAHLIRSEAVPEPRLGLLRAWREGPAEPPRPSLLCRLAARRTKGRRR
ncbi:hypothetical protein ACIHFE_26855 [Streptomyces sp. NPDC052396]|uniref:hypothetical protein n=1 Tax=Streptomyces sp. NPDC052396 TaxID=3365689 RepID=UPI0037D3A8B4